MIQKRMSWVLGPLTQQLFVLQASSSSPQVVLAKCMRTQQVTQARRRQLLLQEMKQLFSYISRNRQTNQARVIELHLLTGQTITISVVRQKHPKVFLQPTNLLIQALLQNAADLMLLLAVQFFDEEEDLPPLCPAEGQRLRLQTLRQVWQ